MGRMVLEQDNPLKMTRLTRLHYTRAFKGFRRCIFDIDLVLFLDHD